MTPYRIKIEGHGNVPLDRLRENAAYAASLGFPEVAPVSPKLAVVGGGPSAARAIEDLRCWPGDIWAINGTCSWLAGQGIKSTLFSVDAGEDLVDLLDGVEDAILASHTHPAAFDRLRGKRVAIFHTEHISGLRSDVGGTTSACRTQHLALRLGYRHVSYFGCEGSFDFLTGITHTFKNEQPVEQLIVKAGDKLYRTNLQFYAQSENLAHLIRSFPKLFFDRSGGLLGGMIAHPDTWEVVALSEALKGKLDPQDNPTPFQLTS